MSEARTVNLAVGDELVFLATSVGEVEYEWTAAPGARNHPSIRDAVAHRDEMIRAQRGRILALEAEVSRLEEQVLPILPWLDA